MDEEEFALALASEGLRNIGELVRRPKWGTRQLELGMTGTMMVAGEEVIVGIGLTSEFPSALPIVFLLEPQLRIPHVQDSGQVCAIEDENTVHDYRRAGELIQEVVRRTRTVLEKGMLGSNKDDFLEEMDAYWPAKRRIPCLVTANATAREVKAILVDRGTLVAAADDLDTFRRVIPGVDGRQVRAIYLPCARDKVEADHPIRFYGWPPTFLSELCDDALDLLHNTRVTKKQSILVILGVPRRTEGRALLGLALHRFHNDAPLLSARPKQCEPISFERYDMERILERSDQHSGQSYVVVGCGAVGGHVAHALAWSAPRELVLVDHDDYTVGNTLRHVLGRAGWRAESKVRGLRSELERLVPGLAVTELKMTAEVALAEHGDRFRSADAVVVAIGNPTVPLVLNDIFAELRLSRPVVYTWLEPYGIGGHALMVRYGAPGCLRCLFDDSFYNTADFAAPGQRFAARELGCSAMYTPYADLDARETALSAARLVKHAVSEPHRPSWFRSWRGDDCQFRSAGFRTSPRYEAFPFGFDAKLEPSPACPTCRR